MVGWYPWKHASLRVGGDPMLANRSGETSAFRRLPSMRPLRVVIDSDSMLDDNPTTDLLAALVSVEGIVSFRWSDTGTPYLQQRQYADKVVEFCPGWVQLQAQTDSIIRISFMENDTYREVESMCIKNPMNWVGHTELHPDLRETYTLADTHRSVILGSVAEAADADIIITKREPLLSKIDFLFDSLAIVNIDDAISLISLYLRMSGKFPINAAPRFIIQTSKWSFYWTCSRSLLHELFDLADSLRIANISTPEFLEVAQKLSWALETRDSIFFHLCQHDVDRDDIQIHVTQFLIWMTGCFDSTAGLIKNLLGLKISDTVTSLHRKPFLAEVRKRLSSQDIYKLIEPSGEIGLFLSTISELRNCIHGELLSAIGFLKDGNSEEYLIWIPEYRRTKVLELMDRQGGRTKWGIDEIYHRDEGFFAPEVMIDHVLETAVTFLESLIKAIRETLTIELGSIPTVSRPSPENNGC